MLHRQRGVFNLYWVAILSAVFAGVAMTALFSMRYQKNYFAEGVEKAKKAVGASQAVAAIEAAKPAGSGATLSKCVINGKTVISNTECTAANPTTKKMQLHDTRGFEAPKAPPVAQREPTSDPTLDRMIEKQMH
ncbi:MAG: DUF4124 domain-containing protein [Gammaproteobacteria bacterium]